MCKLCEACGEAREECVRREDFTVHFTVHFTVYFTEREARARKVTSSIRIFRILGLCFRDCSRYLKKHAPQTCAHSSPFIPIHPHILIVLHLLHLHSARTGAIDFHCRRIALWQLEASRCRLRAMHPSKRWESGEHLDVYGMQLWMSMDIT